VPSLWPETFGLTLHEATASGLCTVASRIGALEEAIVEGQTGLLVPPGDAKALGGALESLRRDRGMRARLAGAGRKPRDVEAMAEETRAIYEELRRRDRATTR